MNTKRITSLLFALIFVICALGGSFSTVGAEETGEHKTGDIDGDKDISATDYLLMKRHILKISVLSGAAFSAADIDGNGKIDTSDLILVKRHLLKIHLIDADELKIPSDFKIGFIFLHDNSSSFDKNIYDSALEMKENLKLSDDQVLFRFYVPESDECFDAAEGLAKAGCNIVFADSFGHEPFMLEAAKKYPNVQFCHAEGTKARVNAEKVPNYHNAYAAIYEGRYLTGIAAGMKLNDMIAFGSVDADNAVIGFVGAFWFSDVVSSMTAFYLGARSVCPSVTMKVKYVNSWYDEAREGDAARELINAGCMLISQYSDSVGAPKACKNEGIPNVSYNLDCSAEYDSIFISSKINWTPYFEYIVESTVKGEQMPSDYTGSLSTGSVKVFGLNETIAAAGTEEAINAASAKISSGELHVFDTSKFTVNGETLTEYLADVEDNGDYVPETNVIHDGYFDESGAGFRSSPYFDIRYIDGITEIK